MDNQKPEFEYEIVEMTDDDVVGTDKAGNPIYRDAFGQLFNPEEEAAYFDENKKQDATLNMRLNAKVIEDLKIMAARHGENNYQAYVRKLLYAIAMQAHKGA